KVRDLAVRSAAFELDDHSRAVARGAYEAGADMCDGVIATCGDALVLPERPARGVPEHIFAGKRLVHDELVDGCGRAAVLGKEHATNTRFLGGGIDELLHGSEALRASAHAPIASGHAEVHGGRVAAHADAVYSDRVARREGREGSRRSLCCRHESRHTQLDPRLSRRGYSRLEMLRYRRLAVPREVHALMIEPGRLRSRSRRSRRWTARGVDRGTRNRC